MMTLPVDLDPRTPFSAPNGTRGTTTVDAESGGVELDNFASVIAEMVPAILMKLGASSARAERAGEKLHSILSDESTGALLLGALRPVAPYFGAVAAALAVLEALQKDSTEGEGDDGAEQTVDAVGSGARSPGAVEGLEERDGGARFSSNDEASA